MKTSHKILLGYGILLVAFLFVGQLINANICRRTLEPMQALCERIDRAGIRAVDLREAENFDVSINTDNQPGTRIRLDFRATPETLSLRGDTLVVQGGSPLKTSYISLPQGSVMTVIERSGTRTLGQNTEP